MFEPFADPVVKAAFDVHPEPMRSALLRLRHLVLAAGARDPAVGDLVETLKWGEPAYLPKAPRIGTTVRLNAAKGVASRYAAYFHCKTTLLQSFRLLYTGTLSFEGNRAITFSVSDQVAEEPFMHCVALALTYHLQRTR